MCISYHGGGGGFMVFRFLKNLFVSQIPTIPPGKIFTQVIINSVNRVWTRPSLYTTTYMVNPPSPPFYILLYLFFYFWQCFFSQYWPQWMRNKYKDKLIKTQQTQIRTQIWPSSTPHHTPFLNPHPRHTSIWITPRFHKTILSNLFYYFSKISTSLIYKEKVFHNTIIPQTKDVYSFPQASFF